MSYTLDISVMVHHCNCTSEEVEVRGLQIPAGQPGLDKEMLSQKSK